MLRSYDPQIGRFLQWDPYDQFSSGYVGMGNDPVNFVDEDGGLAGPGVVAGSFSMTGAIQMLGSVIVKPTLAQKIASKLRKVNRLINSSKALKTTATLLRAAADFAPFVGSSIDIYEGVRDGDLSQIGIGVVGLVTDAFGGSLIKGAIKTGVKVLAKTGAKKVVNEASEGIAKKLVRKPPCGCFIAGTLIFTNVGAKPIEEIDIGDIVWAYNDTTGQYGQKKVVNLFQYERDSVYHIQVGNEVIKATADHPFYIGGRWLRVAELKVGDSVQLFDGSNLVIEQITVVPGRTTVYNFEVADYHTYYVAGAKVLVHNSDPCENALGQAKKYRNGHLANDKHPNTDVPFDRDGFPDFSKNLYKDGKNDVIIKPTGNRELDFQAANEAAGYTTTPKGYTWHHHQTKGRMQLVETEVHAKTGHTGGFSLHK